MLISLLYSLASREGYSYVLFSGLFLYLCKSILSNLNAKGNQSSHVKQKTSKSTIYYYCMIKYSTQGGISWETQHSALPRAVFATRPPCTPCAVFYLVYIASLVKD